MISENRNSNREVTKGRLSMKAAAAVLAVTDATVLSEHVGTSILVAREGVTTLGDLNETMKRFTQIGAKVTGVVFNAVRPRPGKYGYSYGKYRYSSYAYEQYTKGNQVE